MGEIKELYIIGAGGFGREVADTVRFINTAAVYGGAANCAANGAASCTASGAAAQALSFTGANSREFDSGPVYRIAGFIDEDESKWGTQINDIEVAGGPEYLRTLAESAAPIAAPTAANTAAPTAANTTAPTAANTTAPIAANTAAPTTAVIAIGNSAFRKKIAESLDGFVSWETIIHPTATISPYCEIGEGNILQQYVNIGANARTGRHCCVNYHSAVGHDAVLEDFVSVMGHCEITGGDVLKEGVYLAASVAMVPGVTIGKNSFVGIGAVVYENVPSGITVAGYPAKRIK